MQIFSQKILPLLYYQGNSQYLSIGLRQCFSTGVHFRTIVVFFSKDRQMPGSLCRATKSNHCTVDSNVHTWLGLTELRIPLPVAMGQPVEPQFLRGKGLTRRKFTEVLRVLLFKYSSSSHPGCGDCCQGLISSPISPSKLRVSFQYPVTKM